MPCVVARVQACHSPARGFLLDELLAGRDGFAAALNHQDIKSRAQVFLKERRVARLESPR
jgi:hypothetical protein